MHQGENYPKPLLNLNIGLRKIATRYLSHHTWNYYVKVNFRLVLTYGMFVACSQLRVNSVSISSLLSLLSFQMGANTILDNIPIYSTLAFRKQNLYFSSGEESGKSVTLSAILQISGKLNLLLNLKGSH